MSFFTKLTELQRLERLLARQEARVRHAFRVFLADARSDAVLRKVRKLIAAGDIKGAVDLANSYAIRIGDIIPDIFEDAANAEIKALAAKLPSELSRISVVFDVDDPRAVAIMRRNRLQFVTEFSRAQREATRRALTASVRAGEGPLQAARAFKHSIGLTDHQLAMVDTYRELLENGRREALERAIRDRRFDSTVREAIRTGDPLTEAQIDLMVERYHARFIDMRAETIARTETIRTLSQARHEATRQMIAQTGLDPDLVTRVWRATHDKRTRDTHRGLDGQEVGLNEPFISPSGAELLYPGDPRAPAAEVISCRCTVEINIK